MNQKSPYLPLALSLAAGILSFFLLPSSFAQGTAFLYQGQLNNGGAAANGSYDMQFTVYNALTGGATVSSTVTNFNVGVTNGLFLATVDFGTGVFTGATNLWLNVGVRTNGTTPFTFLSPRQPILPTPYAIFANSASNLVGVLPSSQLSGTLPAGVFAGYTNTVALTNGANLFSGSFSGNGGGVTNVNVTNLTGVLADAQLATNTAYVNSNQTFTGANVFTNLAGNSFSGSFFGNGLVGWVVVPGTSVQAQIDHGYILTNAQNVIVTLPTSANIGDIVRISSAGISGWQLGQNAGQSVLGNFLSFGKSWVQTYAVNADWNCVASSPDGNVMAAAYGGNGQYGVAISRTSGQTWLPESNPNSFPWLLIAASPNDESLALAAYDEPIYISTNLGTSWTESLSTQNYNWLGLAPTANGNNFVAVADSGTGGGIYTNSGTTWVQRYSGGSWTAVSLAAGGSELVAADAGVGIFASINDGGTWNQISSMTTVLSCIACSAAGNRIIAGTSPGSLYISTNSGVSFNVVSSLPTGVGWSGVASSSDGSKLEAVVNGGFIYTSANWGTTWTTNATPGNWTGVASSSDGSKAAAVINNTLTTSPYGIYGSQAGSQSVTTAGPSGYISGGQGSAVELQYIGNNQFMPVSFYGTIWGN